MTANSDHNGVRAWGWLPSVYVMEAMPYAVVNLFAVGFYTLCGVPLARVALWTSLLGLPWVLKPFWSPWLERVRRLPRAICVLQAAMGACFLALGAAMASPHWRGLSLVIFAATAVLSATHDCLADGFYIRALSPSQQAFFSGVRNAFYRIGLLCGFGALMMAYAALRDDFGARAWALLFFGVGALFVALAAWNAAAMRGVRSAGGGTAARDDAAPAYWRVWADFFRKPGLAGMLFFILGYRFAEAQLTKVSSVFMLTGRAGGGLGLTEGEYGFIYGTLGVATLLAGGVFGGWLISKKGLRACFWPMALALNLPDLVYVWFAFAQPKNIMLIGGGVALEQLGYGFGFSAFMVYLLYVARGNYPVAHYAICTAFMALGMLIPGAPSGWLAERLGYPAFFVWVCLATAVSFAAVAFAPLAGDFGKRADSSE